MRQQGYARAAWWRVTAGLVLVCVVYGGVALSVAGRRGVPGHETSADRKARRVLRDPHAGPDSSYHFWGRTRMPHGTERPVGLSPFGDRLLEGVGRRASGPGTVRTSLGRVDLKRPGFVKELPQGLKRKASVRLRGGGGLALGTNLVQVTKEALQRLGPRGVEVELRRSGRVVGVLPERAYVVRSTSREQVERLAGLEMVEAAMPYHGGLKIDLSVGRAPMIERARAESLTLELLVSGWPGAEAQELEAMRLGVATFAATLTRSAVSSSAPT